MAILATERLVKGIEEGLPIAPYSVDQRLIDAYIDAIKKKSVTLNSNSLLKLRLFQQLAEPLVYLTEEKRQLLGNCDIFVLPLPLSIAYCDSYHGKNSIVIATGLIDLISNTIGSAYLQSIFPEELESYYFLNYRRDMSVSKLIANTIFILQYRYYRFGNPLPNILSLLDEKSIKHCEDAINGAILYILMHELGHISLGHLERDVVRPMQYQSTIDEKLNLVQRQEYEADQFALESLIPEARIIGTYWQTNAMSFLQQLELVSGARNNSHPLAINRGFHADALRKDWGEAQGVKPRPDFYKELANRFIDTEKQGHIDSNPLLETSPKACLDVLNDLHGTLQQYFDMSINAMWEKPSQSWLIRA